MTKYVALLRAVNVGGKNRVPMAELRAALDQLGFVDVATYIQSGNIVLRSDSSPTHVAQAIRECISSDFGHDIAVIVRSESELRKVMTEFPYGDAKPNESGVVFLDCCPSDSAASSNLSSNDLDAERFAPDECTAAGDNIYVNCPTSFSKTKLTAAWIEKQTGCAGTRRNWKTVLKLVELLEAQNNP